MLTKLTIISVCVAFLVAAAAAAAETCASYDNADWNKGWAKNCASSEYDADKAADDCDLKDNTGNYISCKVYCCKTLPPAKCSTFVGFAGGFAQAGMGCSQYSNYQKIRDPAKDEDMCQSVCGRSDMDTCCKLAPTIDCIAGQKVVNGACASCPTGFFSAAYSGPKLIAPQCSACPAGKTIVKTGTGTSAKTAGAESDCIATTACTNVDGSAANTSPCECGGTPCRESGMFCNANNNMCGISASVNNFAIMAADPSVTPVTNQMGKTTYTYTTCSNFAGRDAVAITDLKECVSAAKVMGVSPTAMGVDLNRMSRENAFGSGSSTTAVNGCSFAQSRHASYRTFLVQFTHVPAVFTTIPELVKSQDSVGMICKFGTACTNTGGSTANAALCICGNVECPAGSKCDSTNSQCVDVPNAQSLKIASLEASLAEMTTKMDASGDKITVLENTVEKVKQMYSAIDKICLGDTTGTGDGTTTPEAPGADRRRAADVGCGGAKSDDGASMLNTANTASIGLASLVFAVVAAVAAIL